MTPGILFVDQSGATGGGELSLLDIAKHRREACRVVLLSDGPFRALLEAAAVPVTVLPAPPAITGIAREGGGIVALRALAPALQLARRLARLAHGHDLIYANTQKAMIVAALAGRLARKPVIWHLRDILSSAHFGRVQLWAAAALANRWISRVIANSTATAEAFVAAGGDPARVSVVHNGIDAGGFGAVSPGRQLRLRAELGLGPEPLVAVFGRLAPWKGQHVLLEALSLLPGVRALVVGAALYGEDAYAESLARQAEAMHLADRVHFLGFRQDVPELMSLARIVVHTSVAPEPFGRVLVEGMLAKRPVVASRAGGALEIIEDGISGVLVPPGDPGALARALAGLMDDEAEAARIAANGQARARRLFSLEAMVARIDQEIELVLAGPSRRREASWSLPATPPTCGHSDVRLRRAAAESARAPGPGRPLGQPRPRADSSPR